MRTVVPANAPLRGERWNCNAGYQQEGSDCVAVRAPANALVEVVTGGVIRVSGETAMPAP